MNKGTLSGIVSGRNYRTGDVVWIKNSDSVPAGWVTAGTSLTSPGYAKLRKKLFGPQLTLAQANPGAILGANAGMYSGFSVALLKNVNGVLFASNAYGSSSYSNYYSSNGTTWSSMGTSNSIRGMAYGLSLYCSVGNSGGVWTSSAPNGTWTPQTSGVTAQLNDIIFANSLFVAVGNGGTIITSPDGTTWTTQTNPAGTQDLGSIAYQNSKFVAVGVSGAVVTSSNGTTWSSSAAPIGSSTLNALEAANGIFVSGSSVSNMYSSTDGVTWSKISVSINPWVAPSKLELNGMMPHKVARDFQAAAVTCIAYANGLWVMSTNTSMTEVTYPSTMICSTDLANWDFVPISTLSTGDCYITEIGYASGYWWAGSSYSSSFYGSDSDVANPVVPTTLNKAGSAYKAIIKT